MFINDPRYVLLPSETLRQEVYEEYCREVARNRRLGKSNPHAQSPSIVVDNSQSSGSGSQKKDPEKEYKALLRNEVKSTRTLWDDFRAKWKKDRRFFAFGRDDRQREKVFREHLREVGERKRADAKLAEKDFMELLAEHENIRPNSEWIVVKKDMVSDPRYDAVGSSSLRAELYQKYIKTLGENVSSSQQNDTPEEAARRRAKEKKDKAEASLRARQQEVERERRQMENELQRSRYGAGREEAEREFGSLLVQVVRDHDVSSSFSRDGGGQSRKGRDCKLNRLSLHSSAFMERRGSKT